MFSTQNVPFSTLNSTVHKKSDNSQSFDMKELTLDKIIDEKLYQHKHLLE